MKDVFPCVLREAERGRETVIVVIVDASGSTPRGRGSMLAVGRDGYLTGTVGGGKVEGLAIARATECLMARTDDTLFYNMGQTGEHQLGLACGGNVLLHYLYVDPANEVLLQTLRDALGKIAAGQPGVWRLDTKEGTFELPLLLPERAIVYGGGHVAKALVPILASCGFRVFVFDDRPEYADASRFPSAAGTVCGSFDHLAEAFSFTEDDYHVVVTDGHKHDYEVEAQILAGPFAYLGVIGSRKKTALVQGKLLAAGFSGQKIASVHAPIGIAIHSVTPAEIAVSIAAEMIRERAAIREARGLAVEKGCPA